ncbi:MAG: protein-export chaperone SecB [Alphaproteobacteria bacterium]|nr:protein-export chaperone SecB [Alphaproteobacteria bacterium]
MTDSSSQPQGADDGQPQFGILAQYVKDLSFENPRGPQALQRVGEQPKLEISVDVRVAQPATGTNYEVALHMSIKASAQEQTAFLVELTYAGMFNIKGLNQDQLRQVLLIECPRLLFPFARRVIADATRDGGFPPLLLNPIDFQALYLQQQQQRAAGGN